jgi:hypothetical protein
MIHFVEAVVGYLFGCHHKALSRVFTIGHRTYQVCCDCGTEFEYSLKTMSAKQEVGLWRGCPDNPERRTPSINTRRSERTPSSHTGYSRLLQMRLVSGE